MLTLLISFYFAVSASLSDSSTYASSASSEPNDNGFNLVTFNTYQIAIAPNRYDLRAAQFDLIHEKYAETTDIFCFNELFYSDDITTYNNEFMDDFPYSYSELEEWTDEDLHLPQISCPTELITVLDTIRSATTQMIQCFDECELNFIHNIHGALQFANCLIAQCLIPTMNARSTSPASEEPEIASFDILDALR
eukprot:229597_1